MNAYLATLGWWNFIGCILMLGFFNREFGKKMLNDWTKIFTTEFELNYWSKFWLAWAIGLNFFFGAVNIGAARWDLMELKMLCLVFDIIAYVLFIALTIWGIKSKHTGAGIYSVFIIFGVWLGWGVYSLVELMKLMELI